uniref:Uncharacterized protein n=1 Tax=Aureoumbra lagunensis TaxID=44058 RepID=A0A7S3JPG1_9STRA
MKEEVETKEDVDGESEIVNSGATSVENETDEAVASALGGAVLLTCLPCRTHPAMVRIPCSWNQQPLGHRTLPPRYGPVYTSVYGRAANGGISVGKMIKQQQMQRMQTISMNHAPTAGASLQKYWTANANRNRGIPVGSTMSQPSFVIGPGAVVAQQVVPAQNLQPRGLSLGNNHQYQLLRHQQQQISQSSIVPPSTSTEPKSDSNLNNVVPSPSPNDKKRRRNYEEECDYDENDHTIEDVRLVVASLVREIDIVQDDSEGPHVFISDWIEAMRTASINLECVEKVLRHIAAVAVVKRSALLLKYSLRAAEFIGQNGIQFAERLSKEIMSWPSGITLDEKECPASHIRFPTFQHGIETDECPVLYFTIATGRLLLCDANNTFQENIVAQLADNDNLFELFDYIIHTNDKRRFYAALVKLFTSNQSEISIIIRFHPDHVKYHTGWMAKAQPPHPSNTMIKLRYKVNAVGNALAFSICLLPVAFNVEGAVGTSNK